MTYTPDPEQRPRLSYPMTAQDWADLGAALVVAIITMGPPLAALILFRG